MKKLSITALGALLVLTAGAQATDTTHPRIVDQHIPLAAGAKVKLDIQITDSIQVITWDRNEVWVKGSININDNKDNDRYTVDFDKTGGDLDVKARIGKMNEANRKKCNCDCSTSEIGFTVYVPAGVDLSVETINGNITITGPVGAVRAHTISGFVDMSVKPDSKADLKFSTISGNMYSNLNLDIEGKHNLPKVGGNVTTTLNGGGRSIDLETISGDIYLRKS